MSRSLRSLANNLLIPYFICYQLLFVYWIWLLASKWSERDTLRGNTIENRGYLFVYTYAWTYVCHFELWTSCFCVCFVVYPFPYPPLNRTFWFSDPVSFLRKLIVYPFVLDCFWMTQDALGLKNLLLDSTLCSNSLELLIFLRRKMLWRMVTMVLKPFTRCNKTLGLF